MTDQNTSRKLPDTLYKFRPFSLHAIADMAANRVFLSSPRHFNDAYDCNIPWNGFLSAAELKRIADNGGPFAETLKKLKDERPELFESGWQLNDDGYLHLRGMLVDRFAGINDRGICSLSAVRSDIRMWAHYADSRRGFCLGFSTRHDPFTNATAVHYSESMKQLDAYQLLAGKLDRDAAFEYLVVKADAWSEEKEFRVFNDAPDTHLHYPVEAVRNITFGDRTAVEHMVICHGVLPPHVEFLVATPKGDSYAFEATPIDRKVLERYR